MAGDSISLKRFGPVTEALNAALQPSSRSHRHNLAFLLIGVAVVASLSLLPVLSSLYPYGEIPNWNKTFLFVGILSLSGIFYGVTLLLLPRMDASRRVLAAAILLGFLARLVFFGSTPMFEDDWHRYLWDGAVVNAGLDPYAASPAQGLSVDLEGNAIAISSDPTIARLQSIGADHPHFPERINYPYVTTIYPPLALSAFAAANLIAPFNLDAFRLVLLVADTATIALLIFLLRAYGRSPYWAVLYWWNPILIITGFNAAHMDILLGPFLLAALAFATFRRPRLAAIGLAAAAGIKLWPIVLAPVVFRAWRKDIKEILISGSVFAISLLAFTAPLILSLQSQHSGLGAYATGWVTNSFLFSYASAGLSAITENGAQVIRIFIAGIVGAAACWFAFSRRGLAAPLPAAMMLTVVLLFFLSPTGYPWYAAWFLLLAPFAPLAGVALLTVLLPIYYLRFLMAANGWDYAFNHGFTLIEFGAPLLVLLLELRKRPPWRV